MLTMSTAGDGERVNNVNSWRRLTMSTAGGSEHVNNVKFMIRSIAPLPFNLH